MTNNQTHLAMRELSDSELNTASGGAINARITLFGMTLWFQGGDDWQVLCMDDGITYNCTGSTSSGTPISGSGPVPQ